MDMATDFSFLDELPADHTFADAPEGIDFADVDDPVSPTLTDFCGRDDRLDHIKFSLTTPPFQPQVSEITPPPTQETDVEADMRNSTRISPSLIDPELLAPPPSQQQQHRSVSSNARNSNSSSFQAPGFHGHDFQPYLPATLSASDGRRSATTAHVQNYHHAQSPHRQSPHRSQNAYQYPDLSEQYRRNPGGPAVFLTVEERRARDQMQQRQLQEQGAVQNNHAHSHQQNGYAANVSRQQQPGHHAPSPGPRASQHAQQQNHIQVYSGAQSSHLPIPASNYGAQRQPSTSHSQPQRQSQSNETQHYQNKPSRAQQISSGHSPNVKTSDSSGPSPYDNRRPDGRALSGSPRNSQHHSQQNLQGQHFQPNGTASASRSPSNPQHSSQQNAQIPNFQSRGNAGSNGGPGSYQRSFEQNQQIQQHQVQDYTNGPAYNQSYSNGYATTLADDQVNSLPDFQQHQQQSPEPNQYEMFMQSSQQGMPEFVPSYGLHYPRSSGGKRPETNPYKRRAGQLNSAYPNLDWAPPLSTLLEPLGWHHSSPPVDDDRVKAEQVAQGKMIEAAFIPSLQAVARNVDPSIRPQVIGCFRAAQAKVQEYLTILSYERKQVHDHYMALERGQHFTYQLYQKQPRPITAQTDQQLNAQIFNPNQPIDPALVGGHHLAYPSYQQGPVPTARNNPSRHINAQVARPAVSSLDLSGPAPYPGLAQPRASSTISQANFNLPTYETDQVSSASAGNTTTVQNVDVSAGPDQETVSAPAAGNKRKRTAAPKGPRKAAKPATAKQTKGKGKGKAAVEALDEDDEEMPIEDVQTSDNRDTHMLNMVQITPSSAVGGKDIEKMYCEDYPNCNHKDDPIEAPATCVNMRNWYAREKVPPIEKVNITGEWLNGIGIRSGEPIPEALKSGNYLTEGIDGVIGDEADEGGEDEDDDEDEEEDEEEEAGPSQSKKRRAPVSANAAALPPAKKQRKGRNPPGKQVVLPHFMGKALLDKGLQVYTDADPPEESKSSKEQS